jgi:hypothetical protein
MPIIEDILVGQKKKRIKCGKKGKRVELELVKDLNKRFSKFISTRPDSGGFSRSVGSGNRWGQNVRLSKSAQETYSGDITTPEGFKFVIESKGGYEDIDLCSAFDGGIKELDAFLKQVSDEAERTGKKPLLVWKKDRKPRLAFLETKVWNEAVADVEFTMKYRTWTIISYQDLMSLDDKFFFSII